MSPVSAKPAVTAPDLGRVAVELRLACQRIARRVRFESAADEAAPHQLSALFQLEHGARTPGELAAHEMVSAPSMTRTVHALVDRGYAARGAHPQDGRQVLVHLTDEGFRALAQARARRDAWMARHLEGLTPDDLALLARATQLLNDVAAR